MSLKSLLNWHYFSLQSNAGIIKTDSGALERKGGFVTVPGLSNLRGHLQTTNTSTAKGRNDTVLDRRLKELETYHTLFHGYRNTEFNSGCRILVNVDPVLPVVENDRTQTRIFEFIGNREPVRKPGGLVLFECYLKEINWQSL